MKLSLFFLITITAFGQLIPFGNMPAPFTATIDYCQPANSNLPALVTSFTIPDLPSSCARPAQPTTTSTATVSSGSASDLQTKLDAAVCGAKIVIPANANYLASGGFVYGSTKNRSWVGTTAYALNDQYVDTNHKLQKVTTAGTSGGSTPTWNASTSGTTSDGSVVWTNQGTYALYCPSQPVYIVSSLIANIPTDVAIAQSNSPANVPKLSCSGSGCATFLIGDGVDGVYISGVEFTMDPAAINNFSIVGMGALSSYPETLPDHVTFNRNIIHPAPCTNDTMAAKCHYVARGLMINSKHGTAEFNNIYGIVNAGQDAQGILVNNSVGPGLFLGNYVEATGENIMFNTECTINSGGTVSGHHEIPKGSQSFTTGDIGMLECLPPSDYTVRLNHLKKLQAWQTRPTSCSPGAFQCYTVKNSFEVKHGKNILFDSNILDGMFFGAQSNFIISNCFAQGLYVCRDITITNNMLEHGANFFSISGNAQPALSTSCGGGGQPACVVETGMNHLIRNNLAWDMNGITYGGPNCNPTPPYSGCATAEGGQIQRTDNNFYDHNSVINMPAQFLLGFSFSDDPPTTDLHWHMTNSFMFASPFKNSGNPGAAIAGLPSPELGGLWFIGDYWAYPNIFGVPYTPAYPAGVQSLSSSDISVPGSPPVLCKNNNSNIQGCWASDWALVLFTDFAGGNAGTNLAGYRLQSGSPLHNAGTDGADVGANISAVLAAVAGITW